MNRPINFEDCPPGDNGVPRPPTTMEELLNAAETDWKFKRKDDAFHKLLAAIAMISSGTGQAIKRSEDAMVAVNELAGKVEKMDFP